jgi:hypothetical protein
VIRGTGIINNELYGGVLVWSRLRFIKGPSTGKRASHANPPTKWIRTEVPHLRIVEDDLWQAVKERQKLIASRCEAVTIGILKARARTLHTMERPVSLLSGLLAAAAEVMACSRHGAMAASTTSVGAFATMAIPFLGRRSSSVFYSRESSNDSPVPWGYIVHRRRNLFVKTLGSDFWIFGHASGSGYRPTRASPFQPRHWADASS